MILVLFVLSSQLPNFSHRLLLSQRALIDLPSGVLYVQSKFFALNLRLTYLFVYLLIRVLLNVYVFFKLLIIILKLGILVPYVAKFRIFHSCYISC